MGVLDKNKDKNKSKIDINRNYKVMDFTFKPIDVTAVYHDKDQENGTFVYHGGHTTMIIDPSKKLFDFCNSFLNPIVVVSKKEGKE